MRDIKFRAKSIPQNEWIFGFVCFAAKAFGRPLDSITIQEVSKDGGSAIAYRYIDEYTISQFTGLRDKKHKEIYEGDIVKFTPTSNSKEFVRPIKWLGASFTFGEMSPLNYPSDCYEVIGNIYDNPELLKNK